MAIAHIASAIGEKLSSQWPYFLTTVLTLLGIGLLQSFFRAPDALSKIPLIGREIGDEEKQRQYFVDNARAMYEKGYFEVKKGLGLFRLPSTKSAPLVVVDPDFLPELRNLPDDVLSFSDAIGEDLYPEFTGVDGSHEIIPHVVKRDLTPGLHRLNPIISEEVDLAIEEEFPLCKDWTPVPLNEKLLRIVSRVSGRIFVGPELCHFEDYIDMGVNYTVQLFVAIAAIRRINAPDRARLVPDLPEYKALRDRQETAFQFLKPVIEARQKAQKEDPGFQKPDDILQWVLDDGQAKYGQQNIMDLTRIQLNLTFAAIHTTNQSTMNALYCLAVMPELVVELREEIRSVLREHGSFSTLALQSMKKLDSFLRETFRVYPGAWAAFTRKVLKPIVLSNGQVLPKGCIIEIPIHSSAHDPDRFDNPTEFDPFRSYRLRVAEELQGDDKGVERAAVSSANLLVTSSPSALGFGYGRHACPGRFFAANEIKMILGRLLLYFDMKNADGSTERYPNIVNGQTYAPDPKRTVLLKRI